MRRMLRSPLELVEAQMLERRGDRAEDIDRDLLDAAGVVMLDNEATLENLDTAMHVAEMVHVARRIQRAKAVKRRLQ